MTFHETPIAGAYLIELSEHRDDRGFFSRAFCRDEFLARGLNPTVAQANLSYSQRRGTLRGLHYQAPPAAECKLVRCIRGAIYDVIVDVRPASPSYLCHFGVELSADNRLALYVPEGVAHGCQTLCDATELFYLVSAPYTPGCERGLRYDDPALKITWPLPVSAISAKDAAWPLLEVTR